MEKNLYVLVGPQGSGKTSYCREHLPTCLRISQDDQGRQEHFHLFQEALQRGEPCLVVDRINAVKSAGEASVSRDWSRDAAPTGTFTS